MKNVIAELREIVNAYVTKIEAIPEAEFSAKPQPHKWSKKEVLGHLIDSAHNNLRRFICGQYESEPPHIVYQQDFWVASNRYQDMSPEDVIALWRLMNFRICTVLESMPVENYGKECDTGALHSLEWIAKDYVKHLKHHMNQIISKSFDVIYQ
ncbi:MAG TPA: DinB family protein [Chryseosolibacter sp.]|nr:DinB family protein [Chryseosolibacter sp.]